VAAALAVRVVVLAQLADHPLLQPSGVLDDAEYFRLGARAAAGDWLLGPRAYYVSPLYIYFLAIVFKVSGAVALHARVAQVLLGAAAAALVGRGAGRLFGPRAEPFAAALAALTGVFAFNEILLLQSAIDPFLAALALERLAAAVSAPSRRRFLIAGIALGLLGLNRPNALPAAAAVVVVAAIAAALARSRAMTRDVALLAAGVAMALAPVALRNRAVTGEWVLVASHGGLNFFIGNNPDADGTYVAPPGITPTIEGQTRDTRRIAEAAEGRPLTDSEVSDHFYRSALGWIRDEPARAAALFVRKLALAANRKDAPLNYSYAYWSQDEPTLLKALVVGPWLLVPLGIAGLLVPRVPPRASFAVWASFIPAYALSLAIFFVASRYRLPLLVALCVTAGGALEWARRSLRAPRASGVVRVAAVGALGAVIAFWPLTVDEGVASERTERVVHLIADGRPEEARALLERTLPSHRDPGLLHYRVGRAFLDTGRPDLAVEHFEKSLAAAPDQGEVHLVLGQALLALRRPAEALPHLERARAANVFADVAGVDLARALVALGRDGEARGVVASTPVLEDTDAPTALALADLARQLGDAATALRFADDAVRRAPALAAARESRGLALVPLGRMAEAIAALEEACRLDPSDPTAPYNLALLYARGGRFAEARRFAQRALELDPRSPHPRALLDDLPPS
jgi:tetratricopeptide (TPR) repeat protein